MSRHLLVALCAGVIGLAASSAVRAADGSWNVNAAGSWDTAGNWLGGVVPGATTGTTNPDIASFLFTLTTTRAVTVDANRNIGGISFGNPGSAYALSGGNLLLSNGGVIQTLAGNGNHTDSITSAIAIQGDGGSATFTAGATSATSLLSVTGTVSGVSTAGNTTTLTLNGSNTGINVLGIVVDGPNGGNVAIVKDGAGTWQINTTGVYTGGVTINAGTLKIAGGSTILLGSGTAALTMNGGELWMANSIGRNQGRDTTIGGNATITSDRAAVGAGVTHSLAALNIGANTLTLQGGANATSGTAGLTFTGAATLTGAATFNVLNNGSSTTLLTLGSTLNNGGYLATFQGSGNSLVTGVVSGSGGLSKAGSGTLTLNAAANTYSGGTTISAGTLLITGTGGAGTAGIQVGAGVLRVNALSGSGAITNAITLTSASGSYILERAAGSSFSAYIASSDLASGLDTTASILSGTAGGARTLTTSFATTPSVSVSNDNGRVSDVFSLDGTSTDLFVLQLQIADVVSGEYLAWLNGSDMWVNATMGNTGNNASGGQLGYAGSFSSFQTTYGTNLSTYVGAYGTDASGNTVWAVLNHNSEFAVIPEPGTVGLVTLAALGFAVVLRKRSRLRS